MPIRRGAKGTDLGGQFIGAKSVARALVKMMTPHEAETHDAGVKARTPKGGPAIGRLMARPSAASARMTPATHAAIAADHRASFGPAKVPHGDALAAARAHVADMQTKAGHRGSIKPLTVAEFDDLDSLDIGQQHAYEDFRTQGVGHEEALRRAQQGPSKAAPRKAGGTPSAPFASKKATPSQIIGMSDEELVAAHAAGRVTAGQAAKDLRRRAAGFEDAAVLRRGVAPNPTSAPLADKAAELHRMADRIEATPAKRAPKKAPGTMSDEARQQQSWVLRGGTWDTPAPTPTPTPTPTKPTAAAKMTKAKAPKPPVTPDMLRNATSPDDIAPLLEGRTAADLRQIAGDAGIHVGSRATKDQLKQTILQHGVQRRLNSHSVSGAGTVQTDGGGRISREEAARVMFGDAGAAAKLAKATPAKKSAAATPKATALSADPAVRAVQVENRVRAAYAAVLSRSSSPGNRWVGLADLRNELGDGVNRNEVDAALRRLEQADGVNVVPESNQKTLTTADHNSAVVIGDQPKHALTIDDPSPRPLPSTTPTPAKKTTAAQKMTRGKAATDPQAPEALRRVYEQIRRDFDGRVSAFEADASASSAKGWQDTGRSTRLTQVASLEADLRDEAARSAEYPAESAQFTALADRARAAAQQIESVPDIVRKQRADAEGVRAQYVAKTGTAYAQIEAAVHHAPSLSVVSEMRANGWILVGRGPANGPQMWESPDGSRGLSLSLHDGKIAFKPRSGGSPTYTAARSYITGRPR